MKWHEPKGPTRFILAHQEIVPDYGVGVAVKILIDRVTGVNYLYSRSAQGGGLTPLLDANGKPIVTPVEHL